jgi:type I site-specific restriction endonuclease
MIKNVQPVVKDIRISSDKLNKQITKLNDKLLKKQVEKKSLNTKLKSVQDITKNLGNNYHMSIKVIIDLSRLLEQYLSYFDKLDKLLLNFGDKALSNDSIKTLQEKTSNQLKEISLLFKDQISYMKPQYIRNNIATTQLDHYDKLFNNLLLKRGGNSNMKL